MSALLHQLSSDDFRERKQAIIELGKTDDVSVIPYLIEALGDYDTRDDESRVNRHAQNALIRFGSSAIAQLHFVLQRVEPKRPHDSWRRYWVAETLGRFIDYQIIPILIDASYDTDREVSQAIGRGYGRFYDNPPPANANDIQILKDYMDKYVNFLLSYTGDDTDEIAIAQQKSTAIIDLLARMASKQVIKL